MTKIHLVIYVQWKGDQNSSCHLCPKEGQTKIHPLSSMSNGKLTKIHPVIYIQWKGDQNSSCHLCPMEGWPKFIHCHLCPMESWPKFILSSWLSNGKVTKIHPVIYVQWKGDQNSSCHLCPMEGRTKLHPVIYVQHNISGMTLTNAWFWVIVEGDDIGWVDNYMFYIRL